MQFYPQGSRAVLNKEYLLYFLKGAREEMDCLINNIDRLTITNDDDCDVIPCHIRFGLIYDYINKAWNMHDISASTIRQMSTDEYRKYGGYPMSLGIECFPAVQEPKCNKPKKSKHRLFYRKLARRA